MGLKELFSSLRLCSSSLEFSNSPLSTGEQVLCASQGPNTAIKSEISRGLCWNSVACVMQEFKQEGLNSPF